MIKESSRVEEAEADDASAICIFIVDGQNIFRDGLRKLLEAEDDFCVVGESDDEAQAVEAAVLRKVDVMLINPALTGPKGLDTIRRLADQIPPVKTILLTQGMEREQLVDALKQGARGVIAKEASTRLLMESIRSVVSGGYWLGQESVQDLLSVLNGDSPIGGNGKSKKLNLTPRELEIVSKIAAGYTNKAIAVEFQISEQTVKHHLTNIFDKLGLNNRLELAVFAHHHGISEDH